MSSKTITQPFCVYDLYFRPRWFIYYFLVCLLDSTVGLFSDSRCKSAHTFFFLRDAVVQALDYADDFITSKQAEIIAYIQSAKEVASDTFGFDGERLRQEMTPLVNNLRIGEHIDQYNEKLGVILTIITADYRLATDSIIPKIVPQLEELRRLFQVNSMDTKEKLMPILEVIKRELTAVYSKLKEILGPYITEYKEQVTGVHQHLKSLSPERKEEIEKILQGIFVQFQSIIEIIYGRAN